MIKFKEYIRKMDKFGISGMFFVFGTISIHCALEIGGIITFVLAFLAALFFDIAIILAKKDERIFIISDEGMKQLKEFIEEYENHKS